MYDTVNRNAGGSMRKPVYTCDYGCPVEATVDVLGGKWKAVILYYLFSGPKRFNELRRLLPNVTQRMLTLQLRELELDGIINREIFKQIPPRVEYSLTEFGVSLGPIVIQMREWGEVYMEQIQTRKRQQMSEVTASAQP
jgi:DNA-binding HxlR family transcriptional regulator